MDDAFRRGIEEFNTQCFFEAHDTWEELWRETSGPERLFLQGLIQVAVGLYHRENGNLRGATSQLNKALDKLGRYLPAYHGIGTEELTTQVRECLRGLQEAPGEVTSPRNSALVPRIRVLEANG